MFYRVSNGGSSEGIPEGKRLYNDSYASVALVDFPKGQVIDVTPTVLSSGRGSQHNIFNIASKNITTITLNFTGVYMNVYGIVNNQLELIASSSGIHSLQGYGDLIIVSTYKNDPANNLNITFN